MTHYISKQKKAGCQRFRLVSCLFYQKQVVPLRNFFDVGSLLGILFLFGRNDVFYQKLLYCLLARKLTLDRISGFADLNFVFLIHSNLQ